MEITLNSEQESFIQRQVECGRFASADEAIREAVDLLEEADLQDELAGWDVEELRKEIQVGIDETGCGEGIALETEADRHTFFDNIKRRGLERLEARQSRR